MTPPPHWLAAAAILLALVAPSSGAAEPKTHTADVCVYAATPSGIMTAVTARRAGLTVILVEPSRWVGGILGAGLKPMQDCPNYAAVGGLTRQLLLTLGNDPGATTFKSMGAISPKAIRDDFAKLLESEKVQVVFEHRVAGTEKAGTRIVSATFDHAPFDALGCPVPEPKEKAALKVSAKIFVDASYEGDLLPRAGVSYRVGREAAAEFDEPHAGVQPPTVVTPIDPYVTPGKPESGLLKWVEPDHGKPVGAADGYTQAYNYRYYTTSDPAHRLPIEAPANYDAKDWELLGRYVEHVVKTAPDAAALRKTLVGICPGWANSGVWNYQRDVLISMAPLGVSQLYADGDYATQARVWKLHQDYLRGLFEFMRTDPRVPESYRKEVAALGLDRRHHADTAGWPNQLYVRIARRVKGDYTVTAHDVYNKTKVEDSIGLAQYGIDTYPSRRIPVTKDGKQFVGIEGKMFVGGNRGPTDTPYPIAYRAIRPKAAECTNLLVPVSFSATHLGYASARMEPVFMIAGEAAGHAAALAISLGVAVQDVPYDQLARRMKADGHRLTWEKEYAAERKGGARSESPATPIKLDGIAVDDDAAEFTGEWTPSTRNPQYVGKGYRHAKAGGPLATATYTAKLPAPGKYEVRLYFPADQGRATAVPVTVKHAGGEATLKVDQSTKPSGGTYQSLGTFAFEATGTVAFSNDKADGYVIADAVEFVAAK